MTVVSKLLFLLLVVGSLACGGAKDPVTADSSSSIPDSSSGKHDRGSGWNDASSSSSDISVKAETVTCKFKNTTDTESCVAGGQSCEGISSCAINVKSVPGESLTWESSCGGQAKTTTDGVDESVEFDCTLTNPVTEEVTCLFVGNATPVNCTSLKGSCSGTVSCKAKVTSNSGAKLKWHSTCADGSLSAWSVVDGKDKNVTFQSCGSAQASETVTCVFKDSTVQNSCFDSTKSAFSCSGVGSCTVKVNGTSGQALEWKGTCGSYAYTVIDGVDENAEFSCSK